jgi:hypothetical protein
MVEIVVSSIVIMNSIHVILGFCIGLKPFVAI